MELTELMDRLTAIQAPSGFERPAAGKICGILKNYCEKVSITPLSCAIGMRPGEPGGPVILLDGHLDQIGGCVTAVEDGFLRFKGSFYPLALPGKLMTVLTDPPMEGVVAVMPPHLRSGDEKDAAKMEDMAIDIGLSQDAAKKAVPPGTPVVYSHFSDILLHNTFCSPSVDDRAAIAAIIYALDLLTDRKPNATVAVMASSFEETGGIGSMTGAFGVEPDCAVALDVTFASQPGAPGHSTVDIKHPVTITLGPHLDRKISRRLTDAANKLDIDYGTEVEAGNTGTNASRIRLAGNGIPTGLVGIPIRNMHTSAETIPAVNIESAGRLLSEFILSWGEADKNA